MNIKNKYVKCFTKEKSDELAIYGFPFLFKRAGVYYHEMSEQTLKFSDNKNLLKGVKYSNFIPM